MKKQGVVHFGYDFLRITISLVVSLNKLYLCICIRERWKRGRRKREKRKKMEANEENKETNLFRIHVLKKKILYLSLHPCWNTNKLWSNFCRKTHNKDSFTLKVGKPITPRIAPAALAMVSLFFNIPNGNERGNKYFAADNSRSVFPHAKLQLFIDPPRVAVNFLITVLIWLSLLPVILYLSFLLLYEKSK